VYESGEWEVDLARRELRARGVPVPIGGRAFEIIEVLVQSAGELVTKNDLMARVWPGLIVEDNALQFHISAIRKALGPDRGILKTASGRGYRLLGAWTSRQECASSVDSIDLEPMRSPAKPFQTNLPAAASELVGRTNAVQDLRGLLSAYRVVTLTGPGGIGKTRLALEVARGLFPSFQGDIQFVELASLSDPGLVPTAVAGVLGLKLAGNEISAESVARAIGAQRLLLVLDNCEHVIDAAAKLAETIVRMCSRTTVLATSREILKIEGEYVYRVPPLDVPPQHEEAGNILSHSAVQLFIATTRALCSDFSPNGENLPAVAAICRRLDGIPLAIDLAAARVAVLGLQQVAAGLNDRLGMLIGGRRTALPRHQTLRATLDWSYELLPESEQGLLRHLAVFPAGFTLEAATTVMSDTGTPAVEEGVANLVAKSLVTLDRSVPVDRWRLLETIRAYALEKLAESGEAERAARRHAAFYRDLVASAAPGSALEPTTEGLAHCVRELDNVRAALDWAFSRLGDTAIGVVLTAEYMPVYLHLSLMAECRERTERALTSLDPKSDLSMRLRMQLHIALAYALIHTGEAVERAKMALATALEIAVSLDDIVSQNYALWALWAYHANRGDFRAAESAAERFSQNARRSLSPARGLVADRLMGATMHYRGDQPKARHHLERILAHVHRPSDRPSAVWFQYDIRVMARASLAQVLCLQGFVDQARDSAQASLDGARAADHKLMLCHALAEAVCPVTLMTGDLIGAERAVAMLIDLATSHSAALWKIWGRCLEGKLLIKRGEFAAGSVALRTALGTCDKTGWTRCYPDFLGALAESLAGLGQLTEALATIDEALARSERNEERWCVAELLRIKGELILREGAPQAATAAEQHFLYSLDWARRQGALSWELRTSTSLARLQRDQGRIAEARSLLQSVYDRFSEGFETADLKTAKAYLDTWQ
jgi:predicted ATPase/DNA-binding winged helix-turn-helix (wHTH) protein